MRQTGTVTDITRADGVRVSTLGVTLDRIAAHAWIGCLLFVALIASINLDGYPAPWFDEGSYLQVARNLAHGSPYAQVSADGVLDYSPAIGVGPTLLIPVAVALRLSDDSLAAARLVTVAFLLLATGLIYLCASYFFGRASALVTLGLLLALPALDWIATGRQVLGEVPALAFLLLGGIIATRNSCFKGAVLAGGLFGLTLVTKGQYLLVLPAAIVLLGIIDRFDRRLRTPAWFAVVLTVALGTWAAWMSSLVLLMGSGQVGENISLLRASSSGALVVFDAERMQGGLRLLLGPSSLGLVVPALIAGLLAVRRADGKRRFGLLALLTFQVLWFAWFAFASIAWPRYAFPALALNAIFGGWMIVEVVRAAPSLVRRFGLAVQRERALHCAAAAVSCVVIVASAVVQLAPAAREDDRSAQHFAETLDRTVPAGAVVDGWEPEIGFFSAAAIQYPPLGSLDRVVRARWLDARPAEDVSADLTGDYLIVGPFGRWVGVYEPAITSGNFTLVERIGNYELWQRASANK